MAEGWDMKLVLDDDDRKQEMETETDHITIHYNVQEISYLADHSGIFWSHILHDWNDILYHV